MLLLAGCATYEKGGYHPKSAAEKKAFARATRNVNPDIVRNDFNAWAGIEVAWAGVIKEIDFKEAERAIHAAFYVEHRHFDWSDKPYRLAAGGEGEFVAGQAVPKPAAISRLKTLAKLGDMVIVYGMPVRMRNGIIQLKATSIRPISADDFTIAEPER